VVREPTKEAHEVVLFEGVYGTEPEPVSQEKRSEGRMINELVQELRSYPAHYVAAHRAADALEKAEKSRSQMHYYACRLEDDLVKLEVAAESMRECISEQQLDIVTLGQEVGRLREAMEKIASGELFQHAHDYARAALGEEKK
jgi:hypothetical protein